MTRLDDDPHYSAGYYAALRALDTNNYTALGAIDIARREYGAPLTSNPSVKLFYQGWKAAGDNQ